MFEVMLVVLMELVEMMLAVMLSLSLMLLLLFAAATIAVAALAFLTRVFHHSYYFCFGRR